MTNNIQNDLFMHQFFSPGGLLDECWYYYLSLVWRLVWSDNGNRPLNHWVVDNSINKGSWMVFIR